MADFKLLEAYETLKTAGERDASKDDQDLAGLAGTRYWDVLKDSLLVPKIAALLLQAEDLSAVMQGRETKEQFAEKAILARITAGHLQDVIERVEQTKQYFDEQQAKEDERSAVES